MELEPTLKVALALHGSPGVYALLLGSGVSTAAGIPTGWQVVLDLVERLAMVQPGRLFRRPCEAGGRDGSAFRHPGRGGGKNR